MVTRVGRLKPLSSLGLEVVNFFQNASVKDIIPSDRAQDPTDEDLLCINDLVLFSVSVSTGEYWALKMLDSWGKFPSGVLTGNSYDLGNFDECLNTELTGAIRGKYCFLKVVPDYLLGTETGMEINIATCLPSSCRASHINNFFRKILAFNNTYSISGIDIIDSSCQTVEKEPWDKLTIALIVILAVMASIVAIFTLIDCFLRKAPNELPIVVTTFSAKANSRALFRVVESKLNPNVIDCLHGIRCMSLFWVIYSHEYLNVPNSANLNLMQLLPWAETPYASFVLHGFYSVDSFFVLGGMLVSLITLRFLDRSKGRLNVTLMYVHRIIRIWPLMAMAILIYMKLMPVVSGGPLFSGGYSGLSQCESDWYGSLLFVQNYFVNKCVGHTWYLAVDMQLFVISPIFLIALYKWGKKAAAGIVILVILLSACLFATIMLNNYSMLMKKISSNALQKMYYDTHTHAAPWLIGFLFGYFLYLNRDKKFQLNWMMVGLGWILSFSMIFTSIFALYPEAKWDTPPISTLAEAFYHTLTRIGWPLALCWVIFACIQGYGGLANSFLSSPLWQPLSRLSFSIYIWHKFVLEVNARNVRTNVYFSNYQIILKFWSDLGITILISFVLHLLIEAPLGGIGNFLKPRTKTPLSNKIPQKAIQESQEVQQIQECEVNTRSNLSSEESQVSTAVD
ncbi:nose resistant to fluoxetine protein 6-like [Drosophila bipectinata]|uniref:nose resistant to fluoxetine protein 6-like n=1 Tax=Drosophila bipectinata TaxID=42026 RepID=UPI001C8A544F|nr:O-acyltransferase like protein-like [Drosophila bipectinata]